MDRGLVLYEDVDAEAQESQDGLQDASSAAEPVGSTAKEALDELYAELRRVNAAINALGDLVEMTSKIQGVTHGNLETFSARVASTTKKGALSTLFAKSNASQVRMIGDEILDLAKKDELAAFGKFRDYTELTDVYAIRNEATVRAAITTEFQKREDAKAAKAAVANARSAPVVHKSEGEHTGHGGRSDRGGRGARSGRGGHGDRGDAPEATESHHVKKSERGERGGRGGRGGQRGGKSTRAALADLDKEQSGAS